MIRLSEKNRKVCNCCGTDVVTSRERRYAKGSVVCVKCMNKIKREAPK